MIIAVDGPAASGKGLLSTLIAKKLDLVRLDTGLLYRAVGQALPDSEDLKIDKKIVINAAKNLKISDLENSALKSENSGVVASKVAVIPEVRQYLLKFQQKFGKKPPFGKRGVVLDGRDIGTVVFPNADHKIFLTANANIRAQRRFAELGKKGIKVKYSRVLDDIISRDERDLERDISPLVMAEDAFLIDSSNLKPNQVLDIAIKYIFRDDKV
tara:strand:- start:1206 stop:1844 length:639 start_codon:yes stop_codon:yes gene_type:complete